MIKNLHLNRGFTLIELLVVIAVVGVLSSVVLSQLNSARLKGSDAGKKSNLRNLATRAVFFYEANNESYNAICNDGKFQEIYIAAGANGNCTNWAAGYKVRTQLTQQNVFGNGSGIDWLCVDQTTIIKTLDVDPGNGAINCP